MKRFLLLFIPVFIFNAVSASHLKGGYITCKHISGRTYEVTLTTFSDPQSQANANTVSAIITFDDGKSETVLRTRVRTISMYDQENVYVVNHTYQSDGIYTISYTDHNLIDGIKNVNGGNSKDLPLSLYTLLTIDISSGSHSSPLPDGMLQCPAIPGGTDLYYNPSFFSNYFGMRYGGPYDSLSYQFVSPANINYTLPQNIAIDPYNGMIQWKNVTQTSGSIPENYLIYYKVSSWLGSQMTGFSIIAQLVKVVNAPAYAISSPVFPATSVNSRGWNRKEVTTSSPFVQEVNYAKHPTIPDSFACYGEIPFSLTDQSDASMAKYLVHFNTDSTFVPRNWPYFTTVRRYFSDPNKTTRDYSIAVYYGASINTTIKALRQEISLNLFPNPCTGNCSFQVNNNGHYLLSITNVLGQKVTDAKMENGKCELDATQLQHGNYFYFLHDQEGKLLTGKLVVE